MSRVGIFLYGVLSYLVFLGVFVYAIGFIGGFVTPTSLDGPPTLPLGEALAINLGLLTAFAIQHSGMARPAFKRWWTKMIPEAAERSTYVLLSSLALVEMTRAEQLPGTAGKQERLIWRFLWLIIIMM